MLVGNVVVDLLITGGPGASHITALLSPCLTKLAQDQSYTGSVMREGGRSHRLRLAYLLTLD